jgi:pilus assembly protein FimV
MRKITNQLFLILCFALLPEVASAMQLGKLSIYSALGEPLNVEIELLATNSEDLVNLSASLASEDEYKALGINKTPIQHNIKASVVQKQNGVAVVQLTSTEVVVDPFLDLMVQVLGSDGQLSREYTLLLDPSVNAETSSQPPVVESPKVVGGQSSDEQAVKTVMGDSLSSVAKRLKIHDVNLDQLLLGLYKANPSAFIDGNMNRLKVGEIIRVPSQESFHAISKDEAKAEVRAQVESWQVYSAKLADIVSYSESSDNNFKNQNAGKIVTDASDKAVSSKEASADVVRLAKAEDGLKDNGANQIANLEDDLAAKKITIKETDEKSALLEKQISDMKQLLVIKNNPLAGAQESAKRNNPGFPYKLTSIVLSVLGVVSVLFVAMLFRRRRDKKLLMTQRFMGDSQNTKVTDVLASKVTTRPAITTQELEEKLDVPEFLAAEPAAESPVKPREVDFSGIDLNFAVAPDLNKPDVMAAPIPDAFNGDFSNLLKVDVKPQQSKTVRKPKSSSAKSSAQVISMESAEIATKLELAIAYIDMSDKKGARKLLAEALEEGGPQQRERAQALIDSLA